jgi:hypothetical protein
MIESISNHNLHANLNIDIAEIVNKFSTPLILYSVILKENEIAKKSCMNYLKIIGHQRA